MTRTVAELDKAVTAVIEQLRAESTQSITDVSFETGVEDADCVYLDTNYNVWRRSIVDDANSPERALFHGVASISEAGNSVRIYGFQSSDNFKILDDDTGDEMHTFKSGGFVYVSKKALGAYTQTPNAIQAGTAIGPDRFLLASELDNATTHVRDLIEDSLRQSYITPTAEQRADNYLYGTQKERFDVLLAIAMENGVSIEQLEQALSAAAGNAADINTRFNSIEDAASNHDNELSQAAGTASDLAARLNVGMEPDGTLKALVAASTYTTETETITREGNLTFSIPVDKSGTYVSQRTLRINDSMITHVNFSSFANGKLTVTIDAGSNLPETITRVEYSFSPNELPRIKHIDLSDILGANQSSDDTVRSKHISDADFKSIVATQDQVAANTPAIASGAASVLTLDARLTAAEDTIAPFAGLTSSEARQCMLSSADIISIDAATVKGTEVVKDASTGIAHDVTTNLAMTGGNIGGMIFGKDCDGTLDWYTCNSLMGINKYLKFNKTDVELVHTGIVTALTATGFSLGDAVYLNTAGHNTALFSMQTTHSWKREFKGVKSVVFDIATNWTNATYMAVRSIEFYKDDVLIPMLPGTNFISYGNDDLNWDSDHAFNTSLSKTGARINNSFLIGVVTNKRLQIVFNTPQDFDRIVINNSHDTATAIDEGIKEVKIYTSTDSITDNTYGNPISNSELIFDGIIAQHTAADAAEDRGYCGVEWAYNPATGFFMFTHDGTGSDFPIENVTGKPVVFSSTKGLEEVNDHFVYSDKTGLLNILRLNLTNSVQAVANYFESMGETGIIIGSVATNNPGESHLTWGFVGEDLGHITPGMTGVEGSFACVELTDGGTFDCGMTVNEVGLVIIKKLTATGPWYVSGNTNGNFEKTLQLNDVAIEGNLTGVTLSDTNLSISPAWEGTGEKLVMVIGKNGLMPSGMAVNINATADKPLVASIADGCAKGIGDKNIIVGQDTSSTVTLPNMTDGTYALEIDENSGLALTANPATFDSSPGVMKGSKKLTLGHCTILNNTIVDIDIIPPGRSYETPWFPVTSDTEYLLANLFKTTKVDFDIWWSNEPTDSADMYKITPDFYNDGTVSLFGAYTHKTADVLSVRTGNNTVNTYGLSSYVGYYKLTVRRGF